MEQMKTKQRWINIMNQQWILRKSISGQKQQWNCEMHQVQLKRKLSLQCIVLKCLKQKYIRKKCKTFDDNELIIILILVLNFRKLYSIKEENLSSHAVIINFSKILIQVLFFKLWYIKLETNNISKIIYQNNKYLE